MIEYFDSMGRRDMTVVSPDAGGVERARAFAKRLNAPLAIIDKRRTDANVAEVMHIIGEVDGQHCLIVDDIIDTAGTLVKGAEALLAQGATGITACATHAVLSGPAVERIENSQIQQVVISNSIPLSEEASRLRVQGLTTAILYGAGQESVAVAVNPKEVSKILHSGSGANTIFNLAVDGSSTPVMIVDHQNDPVRDNLLHVDLKRIDLTKLIEVKIPVLVLGEPKGVKLQGGLLEVVKREIEIECLPNEIPEHFSIDVSELMIGQNVRAGAVALSPNMKLVSSPDQVIAHVIALRIEEEIGRASCRE